MTVDGGNFIRPGGGHFQRHVFLAADVMFRLMERIGYDALTPGEGELSLGRSALDDLLTRYPSLRMVSANVRDLDGKLVFPPYLLIEKDGVAFGVTGVTDPSFYAYFIHRGQVRSDFIIDDPGKALFDVMTKLRQKCDVTVALMHTGMEDARILVERTPTIDVPVQSHNPAWRAPDHKIVGVGKPPRFDPKTLYPATRGGLVSRAVIQLDKEGKAQATRAENILLSRSSPDDPKVTAILDAWFKVDGFETHYQHVLRSMGEKGPGWLERGVPWFVSRVDQYPESTLVYLESPKSQQARVTWWGPLKHVDQPLYAKLMDPARPNPVSLTLGTESCRTVPVGDKEELAIADLFEFLAISQTAMATRDSILDSWRQPAGFVALRGMPQAAPLLQKVSELLYKQRADIHVGFPPYWRRREVVYAKLGVGQRGQLEDITILENNSWPDSVESLKKRSQGLSDREDSTRYIVVGMAMDRGEERFGAAMDSVAARWDGRSRPSDELIPGDVTTWHGKKLSKIASFHRISAQMSKWLSIWKKVDPDCSWDEFICTPSDTVWSQAILTQDPESDIYEMSRIDRFSVWFGYSAVEHPRFENGTWGYLNVPTVWLQERGKRFILRFQGPLSPTLVTSDVRQELEVMRAKPAKRP